MASNDTANDFKNHVRKYIIDHDCYGSDALTRREFVPRSALEDFWTKDKVINVLCRTIQEERIPGDTSEILDHYLVVFSILVWISKPELIAPFMSAETRLDDTQLPISFTPVEWADVAQNIDFLDDFKKAQWRFCPLTFDRRCYMTKLNPYHVLPISNKRLLDSNADEEDDVVVYEALWHPKCLGLLPSTKVVLKVYHMRDQEVITTVLSEVDVYSNLQEDAFNHIVRYFGSFEQQGKLTIVLEYAREGNLVDFLDRTPPPTSLEDRIALWDSFFRLLLGLDATHNLNQAAGNQNNDGRWLLKGIHQDIRLQNILIAGIEPNSYRIYFKLTDFGTGHVRRCRSKGVDMMGVQRQGNGMYSAPESYRGDDLTRPQLCECDIWSLGGVASELLVWSIKGDAKRSEYQDRRGTATGKTHLAGGYHEGSFHDGECRLKVVDNEHKALLESIDKADFISPVVSSIILDHMLVATVADRSSASKVYSVWQSVLPNMCRRAREQRSRRDTSDSFISVRSKHTQRQSLQSILSSPQSFTSKSHGNQWLGDSDPITSEPATMLPGQKRTASRDDSASHYSEGGKRVQFGWQQGDGDPGPSKMYGGSGPGVGGGIRREMSDSSHNPIISPPPFPLRPSKPRQPSRAGTSSSNKRTFSSSSASISGRQTVEEFHDIREVGEASAGEDGTGVGIGAPSPPSPPKTPSVERRNTNSSHYAVHLSPQSPTSSSVKRRNTQLSRRSVIFPQEVPTTITIDEVYEKMLSTEGTSLLERVTSLTKSDLLTHFPELRTALNRLRGRKGREQIFIVDDSASMFRHRDQMGKTVRVLARLLKEGGVDPDKKMNIYFMCTSDKSLFKKAKDDFSFKKAKDLQEAIAKRKFSQGPCDVGTELDQIVSEILAATSNNPVSIYVLTNGRWNANPGDGKDLCGLEGIIAKILRSNKARDRQNNHFGFQFIRFYDHRPDVEDALGKERLDYLDNSLADQFGKLEIQKSDIIDTTDWDEDVCKMLLGGVYADEDMIGSLSVLPEEGNEG